jgi:hypothetical protein
MIHMAHILNIAMAAGVGAPVKVQKNIVETAVAAGSFNMLVKAVQAAGLQDVLAGKGLFTVFAPRYFRTIDMKDASMDTRTAVAISEGPGQRA